MIVAISKSDEVKKGLDYSLPVVYAIELMSLVNKLHKNAFLLHFCFVTDLRYKDIYRNCSIDVDHRH